MEIILTQDIPSLGDKDEILTVKDGYARNYLIPKGLAIRATESARKILDENTKQKAHKEEKLKEQAEELAKQLEDVNLSIGTKTSSTGKIFGSVSNIQIAEKLAEKGFSIDRKLISIENEPVKEVGKYKARLNLHKEVKTDIEFEVVSE